MTGPHLLRTPSAMLPILMSVLAFAVVAAHIAIYGSAREADEGTAAHLFQILIVAQVPLIIFCLFKWLRSRPKAAIATLALQIAAVLVAMTPVAYFGL